MRHTGRIAKWKPDKAFGFIHPDDGTGDVFVHIRDFKSRSREPVAGDPVSYKLALDGPVKSHLRAASVRFLDEGVLRPLMPGRKALTAGLILIYAITLGMLVHTSRLPGYALLAVLLLSVISYLAYRGDKRAAEQRRWRTPESTLHFLSLLGGWPGALIAQSRLAHKSSKSKFRFVFFVTVFLNIIGLGCVALQYDSLLLDRLGRLILAVVHP